MATKVSQQFLLIEGIDQRYPELKEVTGTVREIKKSINISRIKISVHQEIDNDL